MPKHLLTVFLVFAFFNGICQEIPDRYFIAGAGGHLLKMRDASISILRYKGLTADFSLSLEKEKNNIFQKISFSGQYGEINNNIESAFITHYSSGGHYRRLYKLKQSFLNKGTIYLGGDIAGQWILWNHENYINNAFNNNFYMHLRPSVRGRYPIKIFNKTFKLTGILSVPLFGYVLRPSYGRTQFNRFIGREPDNTMSALIKSGEMESFFTYRPWSTKLSVSYPILNGNMLRLSYKWNYTSYEGYSSSKLHPVKFASHAISFSTLLKF